METIEVKLKTKEGIITCDIELSNLSHYRPFMKDGLPDGTLLYLKGNSKGLEIANSFEEFRALKKSMSTFYSRLALLDNEQTESLSGHLDSMLESGK